MEHSSFRLLEHTADIGIEACATTPAALFAAAATGLLAVIGVSPVTPRHRRRVSVTGENWELLLVNWLGEVLYLVEQNFLPQNFFISSIEPASLTAEIVGEPFDPSRHSLEREVKAITYHRLSVENLDGSWRARVYVDL